MSATVTRLHDAAGRKPNSAALQDRNRLRDAFHLVRSETEWRAAPLSSEDQVVQSMPDASPTKWHRAHTTWFFEQFVLVPNLEGYPLFDERFGYLFNSYYVAAGPRHERPKRGLLTRPGTADIAAYRAHVDAAVERLIRDADAETFSKVAQLIELGLNHEQQHQELLLTDILHAFSLNPIKPAYNANWRAPRTTSGRGYAEISESVRAIGHSGGGFHFDNEGPAHRELVGPVKIARALVTNGEWLEFMRDGGYARPDLWLSDGWATANAEGWTAPGYWQEIDGGWHALTLAGLKPVDVAAPVCHVSYYEADAFARWAGKCLPGEAEWEVAAREELIDDAFGVVWQWTRSSYSPYPGYVAPPGAIGEYNGKFMVNQMVLRGSSHATPDGHSRLTYRNFFYPPSRWQFTGVRLAEAL
ncbi:MAG TPA: ergothioneine biosynthesis protein EgtB [Xanthobacteraceae bacterium]|nr:ergothioneine biosynthesis protein EgtB [Xanthobacteraceae bacterium]